MGTEERKDAMNGLAIAREEHALWQKLCAELQKLDAVTESDLKSRLSARDTPGQRLLHLVRAWGEARVEVARVDAKL
jgi:hypothetical protein